MKTFGIYRIFNPFVTNTVNIEKIITKTDTPIMQATVTGNKPLSPLMQANMATSNNKNNTKE